MQSVGVKASRRQGKEGSFATAAGLTTAGPDWINTYIHGVLKKIFGEAYQSPFYAKSSSLVIDIHIYYSAAAGLIPNV
jgi:hypothetical protein